MSIVHRTCELIMRLGLMALIGFTPLAYGTVEPWSIAIMEWGVVSLLLVFLLSRLYPGRENTATSSKAASGFQPRASTSACGISRAAGKWAAIWATVPRSRACCSRPMAMPSPTVM